jgi:hypothetical protein
MDQLEGRLVRLGERTLDVACRAVVGIGVTEEAQREARVLLDAARALVAAVKAAPNAAVLEPLLRAALIEAQFAADYDGIAEPPARVRARLSGSGA